MNNKNSFSAVLNLSDLNIATDRESFEMKAMPRKSRHIIFSLVMTVFMGLFFAGNANAKLRWDFTSSTQGWTARNSATRVRHSHNGNGRLYMDTYGGDPGMSSSGISINAASHKSVKMYVWTYCADRDFEVFFKRSGSSSVYSLGRINLYKGSSGGTYEINASSNPNWTGTITQLRIDPTDNCGSTSNSGFIAFDWIEIVDKPSNPPIVNATLDQNKISHGWSVKVTVASHDPDGDAYSVKWKVNSGSWYNAPQNGSFSISASHFSAGMPGYNTVYVRATDVRGKYGEVSRSVKDYAVPNSAPSSLSPNGQQLNIQSSYRFCFSNVTYRHHFRLVIDDNSNFSSPVYNREVAGCVYVSSSILQSGKTYYWKVCGENILKTQGPWAHANFSIKRVNNPPIISSLSLDQNKITHGWKVRVTVASKDPDYDNYNVLWKTSSSSSWQNAPKNGSFDITSQYFVPGLNTIYVKATDVYGASSPTITRQVTDYLLPSAPAFKSPANYSIFKNRSTIKLEWYPVSGAVAYEVEIDNNYNSIDGFKYPVVAPSTSLIITNPSWSNDVYHWRVRAKNGAGDWGGYQEPYRQFIYDHPSVAPSFSAPAPGASFTQGDSTTFAWEKPDTHTYRYWFRIVRGTNPNGSDILEDYEVGLIEPTRSKAISFSGARWTAGTYTCWVKAMKETPPNYNATNYETTIGWSAIDFQQFEIKEINHPPTVSIAFDGPTGNEITHGWSLSVKPTYSDPDNNITKCEWQVNSTSEPWNTVSKYEISFTITASNFVIGKNTVFMRVTDSQGEQGTAQKDVFDYAKPNVAPSQLSPSGGQKLEIKSSYEFSFAKIPDVLKNPAEPHYKVIITEGSMDTGPTVAELKVTDNSFFVGDSTLKPGKTYSWKVWAENKFGEKGSWAVAENFSIKEVLPLTPTLKSPANYSIFRNPSTIPLEWYEVSGAMEYEVEVYSDTQSYKYPPVPASTSPKLDISTPTWLSSNDIYHWRVRSKNSSGVWGEFKTAGWQFIYAASSGKPSFSAPASNSEFSQGGSTTFAWNKSDDLTHRYRLKLIRGAGFGGTLIDIYESYLIEPTKSKEISFTDTTKWTVGTYTSCIEAMKGNPDSANYKDDVLFETTIGWGDENCQQFTIVATPKKETRIEITPGDGDFGDIGAHDEINIPECASPSVASKMYIVDPTRKQKWDYHHYQTMIPLIYANENLIRARIAGTEAGYALVDWVVSVGGAVYSLKKGLKSVGEGIVTTLFDAPKAVIKFLPRSSNNAEIALGLTDTLLKTMQASLTTAITKVVPSAVTLAPDVLILMNNFLINIYMDSYLEELNDYRIAILYLEEFYKYGGNKGLVAEDSGVPYGSSLWDTINAFAVFNGYKNSFLDTEYHVDEIKEIVEYFTNEVISPITHEYMYCNSDVAND